MAWYTNAGNWLFGTAGTAQKDATNRQNGITSNYTQGVEEAMQPYQQLTDVGKTQQLQGDYVAGLENLNTNQYKTGPAQLQTGNVLGDVNKFMDPSLNFQMDQATKQVESSQAGKGGLFSGAAGNAIAQTTQNIAQQGWGDAYARANQAQQQGNQTALQQQQASQSSGTYNLGLDTTGLDASGKAYEAMMGPLGTLTQAQLDKLATIFGSESGLGQQQLQSQMADTGNFTKLLSAGATAFKGA